MWLWLFSLGTKFRLIKLNYGRPANVIIEPYMKLQKKTPLNIYSVLRCWFIKFQCYGISFQLKRINYYQNLVSEESLSLSVMVMSRQLLLHREQHKMWFKALQVPWLEKKSPYRIMKTHPNVTCYPSWWWSCHPITR